jgi:glycosyltransferase involved in cell wall biosynthesis
LKKTIKKILNGFGIEVRRYSRPDFDDRVASIRPDISNNGCVLLAYIIEPFIQGKRDRISNTHTHYWESYQIAKTFIELGYAVDVIDYRNKYFIPQKEYGFFISARTNFQILAKRLSSDCIKIVHLDTAHWLFNNTAAYQRALELQQRRGVSLYQKSIRIVEPNWAIEHADYASIIGNEFSMNTYRYANTPLFRTPISTLATYPWDEDKNYEEARFNFIWFGPSGLVHKGLDLVLEAFYELPEYHLWVCGPIKDELEFNNVYNKELYETENIHTVGWVDVEGKEFKNIAKQCIGIVYPSCSECGGGSVVQCMHAGLIPIVSYESSVDVDNFGIILKENSIAEIKNSVEKVTKTPVQKLKQKSRMTWEYARKHHTRDQFASVYRDFVKKILKYSSKNNGKL